jgi:streptogramin lyase
MMALKVRRGHADLRIALSNPKGCSRLVFPLLIFVTCLAQVAVAQDLLVSSFGDSRVLRYDGETGAFIDTFATGHGMDGPLGLICHDDGNLYVAGYNNNQVQRFGLASGQFVDNFASGGGLDQTEEAIFGPDGNLYVSSFSLDQVLRYDGTTGAFMDVFASGGGLDGPAGLAFGGDGHLYVGGFSSDNVVRYNGTTGDFMDVFASGPELDGTEGILFESGGDLLVASHNTDQVLRYAGADGNFSGVFASSGLMDGPVGMTFGPDGNLYVAAWNSHRVVRFDPAGNFIDIFTFGGALTNAAYPVFCNTGISINAGMNDAWVSDEAPLQGFFFTVYGQLNALFVAQFTFDSVLPAAPDNATFGAWDQRWVTGLGIFSGNKVTVNVELTSGGIFNASQPTADQQQGYGTYTITFIDCNNATLVYNFPGPGLSGQLNLKRVLPDNIALCELLNSP